MEIDILNLMSDVCLVMDFSYDRLGLYCYGKEGENGRRPQLFVVHRDSPYHDVVMEFVQEAFFATPEGIGWLRKTEEEKRIFDEKRQK